MSQPYTAGFFADQMPESLRTARAFAPHLMELVRPDSVVDVGCGVGTWASAFADLGCQVTGIDGDYVNRRQLVIPEDRFVPADLTEQVAIEERFDLAVCLEVGEHLPPASSQHLVDMLTRLAPVVLFSAAIPWQGGTDHINERWQSEWAGMFARRGYVPADVLHERVWRDLEITPWYAQNAVLYVDEARIRDYPALSGARLEQRDVVHPGVYRLQHTNPIGLRYWAEAFPKEARYTIRQRAKRLRRWMRAHPARVTRG